MSSRSNKEEHYNGLGGVCVWPSKRETEKDRESSMEGCHVMGPTQPPKHADSTDWCGLRHTNIQRHTHIRTETLLSCVHGMEPRGHSIITGLRHIDIEADAWFHFFRVSAVQLSAIQSQPCYLLHWTGSKVTAGMVACSWHDPSQCF